MVCLEGISPSNLLGGSPHYRSSSVGCWSPFQRFVQENFSKIHCHRDIYIIAQFIANYGRLAVKRVQIQTCLQ